MGLKRYTNWGDVPDNLATKTALKRQGLRPGPDQVVAAIKSGGYGPYDLYDVAEAVKRRIPSPAQLAALEKARLAAVTCQRCGNEVYNPGELRRRRCSRCAEIVAHLPIKREVVRLAGRLLAEEDALILDTETTGLDEDDEIIQLSIIDLVGQPLFESLFKPTERIHVRALAVHGIGPEMLETAPAFAECHGQIQALLSGRVVAAFNMDFDGRLLDQTCERYGLAEIEAKSWHCAMRMFARFRGRWSDYHGSYTWASLADAAAEFGISQAGAHHSTSDCRTTLAVVKALAGWESEK